MKGGRAMVLIGVIVGIFGFIFHLQGQSIVGPETSFMYSNPNWITYGLGIVIIGIIISITGFVIIRKV
jgi:hypothetical protein